MKFKLSDCVVLLFKHVLKLKRHRESFFAG